MRGSAAFRAAVAPGGVLAGPWVKNELWRRARAVPSLDLRFADDKSLTDAVTGQQLVTFTRASSGTYVGSDGLIKTATTNLLLRSEEFGTHWTLVTGTISTDSATSPNGSVTADKLIATNGGPSGQVVQGVTIASGATVTGSVYIRAGGFDRVELVLLSNNNTTPYARATFDPSIGTITTAVTTANGGTNASASVVSAGNGWYRCVVTVTYPAVTAAGIRLHIINSDAGNGDGVKGVFLWGAQLEQSSTVGEYIPTTSTINSAPRFDHNPTTGESLGLLVEEQRTNFLLQSEDLLTTWTANDGLVRTANQIVSPAGSVTADRLASGGTQIGYLEQPNASSNQFVSGTTYTYSVYLKKANTSTCLTLLFGTTFNSGGGNPVATWNLDTGVPAFTNGATGSMTAVGDGWYRCVMTDTATQTHTQNQQWLRMPSTSGDVYVWGAQLEAGAFPTSYISTTTATVTRSADVPSITGTAFSSWYRQDEGTVFEECAGVPASSTIYNFHDGTANNRIIAGYSSDTNIQWRVNNGGVDQWNSVQGNAIASRAALRHILGYKADNFAGSANGGALQIDTSGTVPTTSSLAIGMNVASVGQLNGTIKRLAFFPQRLPDSTLQAITQ